MKQKCSKCGHEKTHSEFYARKSSRGVASKTECKDCIKARVKSYYHTLSSDKLEALRQYKAQYSRKARNDDPIGMNLRQSLRTCERQGYRGCSATKEELEAAYTGKCDSCGISVEKLSRRLNIDHDHVTGCFRGWLCTNCNCALGLLGESEDNIHKLSCYIHSCRESVNEK